MKNKTLPIKELWREIIIIFLFVFFYKYLIKFVPFLKGWLNLFILSFSTGFIGGYLIAKKSEIYKSALLIPALIISLVIVIPSFYTIISFATANDEKILSIFSNDPKWINYNVNMMRYTSIGGALLSLGMFCPIIFIVTLIATKLGIKIKNSQILSTNK